MKLSDYVSHGLAIVRARWYFRHATAIGQGVRVWGRPAVRNDHGQMMIAERAVFISTMATLEMAAEGGRLEIGARTFVNYGCSIVATQLVQIGADCKIGKHCILIDNDFHRLEPERRNERPPSMPIVLENQVWLGSRVIVLRGVRIGVGSVVGAGSVVTKDVPSHSLAVGVPARVVRQL